MFSDTRTPRKIHIIDNDRAVRLVLATILKKGGFDSVQAADGAERNSLHCSDDTGG